MAPPAKIVYRAGIGADAIGHPSQHVCGSRQHRYVLRHSFEEAAKGYHTTGRNDSRCTLLQNTVLDFNEEIPHSLKDWHRRNELVAHAQEQVVLPSTLSHPFTNEGNLLRDLQSYTSEALAITNDRQVRLDVVRNA